MVGDGASTSRKQTHIENKRGRRNASPTGIIIFFCRGRRPRRPASNDNDQIKNQHVILSEEKRLRFTQSKFYRARSEVKPRSDSDDGISLQIWVACHNKCNIPRGKPPRFVTRSRRGYALRFCSFASLNPQKFDKLRMTYSEFDGVYFSKTH